MAPFGEWLHEWEREDAENRLVTRERFQQRLDPATVRVHQRLAIDGARYVESAVNLVIPVHPELVAHCDRTGYRILDICRSGPMTEMHLLKVR